MRYWVHFGTIDATIHHELCKPMPLAQVRGGETVYLGIPSDRG